MDFLAKLGNAAKVVNKQKQEALAEKKQLEKAEELYPKSREEFKKWCELGLQEKIIRLRIP